MTSPAPASSWTAPGILSRGVIALIGLLGVASVAVIAVVSLVVTLFGLWPDGRQSFDETFWSSLMHALDSGTLGGDQGVGLRAAELVVTIGGIIVVASSGRRWPGPARPGSVIILAPEDSDDPDSVVIKTALALTNNPRRKAGRYHIVGEIRQAGNMEAARLVGRDEADWVLTDDLISRITVQTSRQSGLSVVYTELLDFGGDEIYFSEQPGLVGKLILIAEDDSTVRIAAPGTPDMTALSPVEVRIAESERALILGYNKSLHPMLTELDQYVVPGFTVTVVAETVPSDIGLYKNLTVTCTPGDPTSRAVLESLDVHGFDHIIVLADKDNLKAHRADAKTLITLLHLRDMATRLGIDLNVVSEMLDDRNRELAEVTQADDFIVSDKLISLMLSQISENDRLSDVFQTLFSSVGSEIYLRAADSYIKRGTPVDFYTVVAAAGRRGETAIGYRIAAHIRDEEHAYGIVVNPNKAEKVTFAPGDKVIVLAED